MTAYLIISNPDGSYDTQEYDFLPDHCVILFLPSPPHPLPLPEQIVSALSSINQTKTLLLVSVPARHVRADAFIGATVWTTLHHGDVVEITSSRSGWGQVDRIYPSGELPHDRYRGGWIYLHDLTPQ